MPESFVAYFDESGCTGFKFDKGSTEWFVMAALVVRRKNEPVLLKAVKELRDEIRLKPKQSFHFSKQNENQRHVVLARLSQLPVRIVAIAFHKPSLLGSFRAQREQMFNYAARFCIERVSWLCTKHQKGTKEVELVFSQRKQMSRPQFEKYISLLKDKGDSTVHWDSVCPSRLRVEGHDSTALLQMADYACSAVRYSFEEMLSPQSYLHHFKENFYRHSESVLNYGLKFLPKYPELKKAGLRCGDLPFV